MATRRPQEFYFSKDFDSKLVYGETHDGGNVVCEITLGAYYHPVKVRSGPPSGYFQEEDDRYGNDKWESIVWNEWKKEYALVIEEFWKDRFWLKTPDDYDRFNQGNTHPNVRCSVRVDMLPFPGGAHQTFNINRVADYRINRAHAGGHGYTGWRADVGYEPTFEPKPLFIQHVDHLYALPHKYRSWSNYNRYFRPESPFMDDDLVNMKTRENTRDAPTFGMRNERSAWHATPWQTALEKHTDIPAEKWKVSTQRLYPERLGAKKDKDKEKEKK